MEKYDPKLGKQDQGTYLLDNLKVAALGSWHTWTEFFLDRSCERMKGIEERTEENYSSAQGKPRSLD